MNPALKTALIIGITSQDGSYMAELLLSKGYRVVGTSRNINPNSLLQSHNHVLLNYINCIEFEEWDLISLNHLIDLMQAYRPHEIYNFAAYTSGSGVFDLPIEMQIINSLAVTKILEAILQCDPKIRFCQASSSEMFGVAKECPQTEDTRLIPDNPYGASKLYAHNMVGIYRKKYHIYGCSAILYNHESPIRGMQFVSRKITHIAAQIKLGQCNELNLGSLNAKRDWSFAGDFVRAMWLMLQQESGGDYVLASGNLHSVQDLCEIAFNYLGLNYQDYVKEDLSFYRPQEGLSKIGNAEKIRALGWSPNTSFEKLIQMMVDRDVQLVEKMRSDE